MSKPWTTSELEYLRTHAGRVPTRQMQRELLRSAESIRAQAKAQGLSLRCATWRLTWCNVCATWRTRLCKDGMCRVCHTKGLAHATEVRMAEEERRLPMAMRAGFEAAEARRGTTAPMPPKPRREPPRDGTPYEQSRAEQEHLQAVEEWELLKAMRRYNAARQRLKDIKAATEGHKGSEENQWN